MALQGSQTADKIIVDRTKAHRNSEVAKAVRRTRDRLSQREGIPDFDRELLKIHARAVVNSAVAIPLLMIFIGVGGLLAGMSREILVWTVAAITCYAALAFVAKRTNAADTAEIDPAGVKRGFLVGHFLSGLGWAYFALLGCDTCGDDQLVIIKAVVLLLAIAATALIASALRGALIVTFALPVAVFTIWSAQLRAPVEALMVAVLVASLPFFTYVAGHLHKSALMLLSFRTEKDALIAELETAKSMSDEARRRAEEANLAKSRFLASMSHELRTPLNAILGFSEVMGNEVLGPMQNETYREYARDIHGSGQHLLNLINEILDLSRIEAGRYQLNEEPLVLTDVVDESCHMMELRARNKGIRIVKQFQTGMPPAFRRRTLDPPDHAESDVERGEVHPQRRRDPRTRWLDRRRRAVHLGQGQRPGHSARRDPGGAFGLRPGLDRHQERRAGNGPRSPDRPGAGGIAWRRVAVPIQAARGYRRHGRVPRRTRHGGASRDADPESGGRRLASTTGLFRRLQEFGRAGMGKRGRLDHPGCNRPAGSISGGYA